MAKRLEILSVEDNEADAHLWGELLRAHCPASRFHVVMDGLAALDFLFRRGPYADAPRPDIVFLDRNIPKIDSREVLTRIKSDEELKRIPVLVVSTSDNERDVAECYTLGANCFLSKPLEFEELDDLVRKTMNFWGRYATLSQ